jgi:WD40 repeat protein
VVGLQLNEFVRRNAGRPDHLRAILGLWVRLCKRLRDAHIAHADLQHGNVLLVPGRTANTLKLRLIDYDGMWVPALAGHPSGEAGHPNYQHPARLRDRVYSADADRFPHLLIGCALRALAVGGKSLWDQFDNGDNMLFREADLADPAGSPVFRALWDLDDPTVTNLVALLVLSARRPLADTPWLDELLSGDRAVPVSDAILARAAEAMGVARRSARNALPVAQLYVVPDEANDLAEIVGDGSPRRPRGRTSELPILLAAGLAMVAAGVVTALLLLHGGRGRDDTNLPLPSGGDGTTVSAPTGIVETRWVDFPSAPKAEGVAALVSGIDIVPPGSKTVRSYPVSGAAALGAWLLPDGARAVLVGRAQIGILDLATGRVRPTGKFADEPVKVTVSPDGRYVVTASLVEKDWVVHCVDPATGAQAWANTFPGAVTTLAVSPDGERVAASGSKVGYVEWALADGTEVRRHRMLQATLLAFSPDGSQAVAAAESGVELWSLRDGKATVVGAGMVPTVVCVTPDGDQALAPGGGEVKSWALLSGRPLPDRPALVRPQVTALAAAGDGILLFGGSAGEYGYLGPDGTHVMQSFGPAAGAVVSFSITGDSRHVLVASEKGAVTLTRLADLIRTGGPSPTGPTAGCLEYVQSVPLPAGTQHFATDARAQRFLTATATHVRVYTADKFAAARPLQVPGGEIVSAGFGPDDTIVVCHGEGDGFVTRNYDLHGGGAGPAFVLPAAADGGPGQIPRIAPVPDRPWVLATTEAVGDVLFDLATGKPVDGWPTPRAGDPTIAAASPDGRRFAFGTAINPVRLWDADAATVGRTLEASVGVVALAFTPDGKKLVGLWAQGRVRVWDPVAGAGVREVGHDHPGPFAELVAVSDSVVALGPAANRVLLHLDTGKALNTGTGPDPVAGQKLVIPTRGWILAVDRDDRLTAWRVNPDMAARLPAKRPGPGQWPDINILRDAPVSPPVGLAFAADGKSVVSSTENGKLTRYSADRLLYLGETDAEESPLYGFAHAADRIFTLGRGSQITVRDAGTMEKLFDIPVKAPGNVVPSLLAVSPDASAVLIMADKMRTIDMSLKREVETAALPNQVAGKPLTQFAFSADGRTAVGRWGDAVLAVWHPKSARPRMLDELRAAVPASPQSLALTPDGRVAVLGTGDGKIATWDTTTGEVLHSRSAYPDAGTGEAVAAVAVLPGGTRCVTAGKDGRIILWELNGLKQLKEYRGPEGPWRLAVAPDGRSVVLQQSGSIQRVVLPAS